MKLHHRSDLHRVAHKAMLDRGLEAEFPADALVQLDTFRGPAAASGEVEDLRSLLWCSIDNDDSEDLDQLTVAEDLGEGAVRILVAVADVDALVAKDTPIDRHASKNTVSVYVAGHVYPMLPERLSTDLTSLNQDADRLSLVVAYVVQPDGSLGEGSVRRALVRNRAKLAYNAVAAWLDGQGSLSEPALRVSGLDAQLRLQDAVAARLRRTRHEHGALDLQSLESRPVFSGDTLVGLHADKPNRAKWLIEDFMIAANGVVARFLADKARPSLRRVVRSPERWGKIVDKAAEYGETLPAAPSALALEAFLTRRRAADPLRFPDLSLAIVKLMGSGEYVVERPGETPIGHFGLSVTDYAHATAPNRRFPDLVTHRLLKAALAGAPSPYGLEELGALASHCSLAEGAAAKVERQVRKSAAALLLEQRVGESFDGVITGAADKGTWVRVFDPPVEGRVDRGTGGLRVGDKVRVRLLATDFERGFIDFACLHRA
jgi:VacB/RNase II family 3'-5' exoribonuclease